jgi:hypothetical protein
MNREIILITDFSNTKEKKEILRGLIHNLKTKYEICVSSHCILPSDIIEDVDFYLYDKKNPIIDDNSLKGVRIFGNNSFVVKFKSYFLPSTHIPAILRLWQIPLSFLKNTGYEIVHILEYDTVIKNLDIFDIHKSQLKDNDVVFYEKLGNIVGNLFSLNLNKFESNVFYYDEEKIYNSYKKIHLENIAFSSERTIYELIFNEKKVLKLEYCELEKFLEIGKCQIMSENFLSEFIFTFYRKNDQIEYFSFNGSKNEISFDLIINYDFYFNLKMAPYAWCLKKLDVTEIKNARAFINNVKYFDIDFTKNENLTLINDVEIIENN